MLQRSLQPFLTFPLRGGPSYSLRVSGLQISKRSGAGYPSHMRSSPLALWQLKWRAGSPIPPTVSSSSYSLPSRYVLLRIASTMEAPQAEDVIAFLMARGFSAAAAALREDLLSRCPAGDTAYIHLDLDVGTVLPPLRLSSSSRGGDGGENAPPSPASSSSDAFVSLYSSPSELLNPYGVWSPARTRSDDESTERYSEFGTARAYNSCWCDDQHGGHPFLLSNDFEQLNSEDKFVMTTDAKEQFIKQESLRNEFRQLYTEGCAETCCSFPICACCHDNWEVAEMIRSSSSVIYSRYQILDDQTERLDECGDYALQFRRMNGQPDTGVLEHEPHPGRGIIVFYAMLSCGCAFLVILIEILPLNADDDDTDKKDLNGDAGNGKIIFINKIEDEEQEKESYSIQPFEEDVSNQGADCAYEYGVCRIIDREVQDREAAGLEVEDDVDDEFHLYNSQADELEEFDLRIIHRKNRTGFEENKEFPIVLKSVIAGRYYIMEYLGSAAFSKVVHAYDLHTGTDVCLKIINNDKDFFDQSLDEIKLLKYANKHDPSDKHHLLRLYDYFYHQEHLFIVTELLRANLYEYQKYIHESGGEEYYTLPRIQAIARQCLEALRYLHHLRIIHCDLKPENVLIKSYSRCEIKVIDLGSSCFETDSLSLYVQSRSYRAPEVLLGLPYDQKIDIWSLGCILAELIPERSLLSHQLQHSDPEFIDFLSHLLQINPGCQF